MILKILQLSWTLCICSTVLGQCVGNQGVNIFVEGDFGTGSENIITLDPLIAPGYTYDGSPPPSDGSYTISNNTALWPSIFSSWYYLSDNSSDENGYMMIVNASNEPGLFYEQKIDNLCANTLYQFTSDIINLHKIGVSGSISPNIDFMLNGDVILETGDVPQDESWHTYSIDFITGESETSIILSLRNNAPGGFGNDLALDNISFEPCGPSINVFPLEDFLVCSGHNIELFANIKNSPFDLNYVQWQYSTDDVEWVDIEEPILETDLVFTPFFPKTYFRFVVGSATANLTNSNCQIISDTRMVEIKSLMHIDEEISLCEGETFVLPDTTEINGDLSEYEYIILGENGCDSIKYHYSIINEFSYETIHEVSACKEEGFELEDGTIVTETGVYDWVYQGENGCDSLVIFNVKIIDCADCYIFPTAFSPNNDGVNDSFGVLVNCDIQSYDLKVYDRWGKLIYHSIDSNEKWNGTYGNRNLPMGVYMWYVKFSIGNKAELKTGNVTIIR